MNLNSVCIAKVLVTLSSEEEILDFIKTRLASNQGSVIFTPNPEIVVEGSKNPAYLEILNKADVNLPDGTGLIVALRMQGIAVPRIRGRDFFVSLLELANQNNYKVFLVGSQKEVVDKVITRLNTQYPQLSVKASTEIVVGKDGKTQTPDDQTHEEELISIMKSSNPQIVFVALGHPKQEFWIARLSQQFPNTTFMAIGGTLTTYSGTLPTPPKLLSQLGLEWFFRLFLEPKRFARIWNAVIVFPILWLKSLVSNNKS